MEFYVYAFILILLPIFNYYRTKKQQAGAASKEHGYLLMHLIYWATLLWIVCVSPLGELFWPATTVTFALLWRIVLWILIGYVTLTTIVPLALMPYNQQFKEMVRSHYDDRLYPTTTSQQIQFAFVTLTVGICEEIIYRGFMYHSFIDQFALSPTMSYLITSVLFGASHFMQGLRGISNSVMFGLIMGYLCMVTGSLLLPIIIHTAYNLRAIYIARVTVQRTEI